MPEFALGEGVPRDDLYISTQIYRLLAVFGASAEIHRLARESPDPAVYEWSIKGWEFFEVGHTLLSIAAMVRNDWDADPNRFRINLGEFYPRGVSLGSLQPDIHRDRSISLEPREALNKIIHAEGLTVEVDEVGGFLPLIHLRGTRGSLSWHARLDVYRFAEVFHALH